MVKLNGNDGKMWFSGLEMSRFGLLKQNYTFSESSYHGASNETQEPSSRCELTKIFSKNMFFFPRQNSKQLKSFETHA